MTTRTTTAPKKSAAKKTAAKKTADFSGTVTEKENTVSETPQSGEATMQQARSAAATRLREEHRDEYNRLLQEEAKKRGIEWTPRPTKEEKDREALRKLLEENPSLRDELLAEQG